MSIDAALEKALVEAVQDQHQPENVSNRMLAWLTALSVGEKNESQMLEYFDVLMDSIVIEAPENED